jgi:hypothetical protein
MSTRHAVRQLARFVLVMALFALGASSTFAAPASTGAEDIIVIGS